jgi:glycosyltransferase involved in cell wall biosynthesis
LTGRPWVADFRDPWSSKPWIEEWERREWRAWGLRRLERLVVRSADRVVLNTDAMHDDFVARYSDVDPTRFRSIPNGYDPSEFEGLAPRPRERGPFRLTHAGGLYRRRSPLALFEAIRNLLDSGAIGEGELELELIGPIVLDGVSLPEAISARRLSSIVRHVPSLPHRDALQALVEADALLIVQPDAQTQVPGKLYEYLYVGKPVVALAHPGATADLIAAGRLGWVADPDRVDQVAAAILAAVRSRGGGLPDPAARCRLLARHDARALTAELAALLRECAPRVPASEGPARG